MPTGELINLWLSVRTFYPFSSINTPFYGYSKLQLHRSEESQNRRRLNDMAIDLATSSLEGRGLTD